MALWGIEVEPNKPYRWYDDGARRKVHISQATLGYFSWARNTTRSTLMYQVGDRNPIYLCSLMAEKLENCALNLELEVDEEVTFSVVGSTSVHLSGFYYGDKVPRKNVSIESGLVGVL